MTERQEVYAVPGRAAPDIEQPLQVPSADASRLEWARYFLQSAQKDLAFQQEQLTWDNEQIAYHQAHLVEYRKHRRQALAKLEAARVEVERLTELVNGLAGSDS